MNVEIGMILGTLHRQDENEVKDRSHSLAKETQGRFRLMKEIMEFVKDSETFAIWPLAFSISGERNYTITLSQNAFLMC